MSPAVLWIAVSALIAHAAIWLFVMPETLRRGDTALFVISLFGFAVSAAGAAWLVVAQ